MRLCPLVTKFNTMLTRGEMLRDQTVFQSRYWQVNLDLEAIMDNWHGTLISHMRKAWEVK